MRFSTKLKLYLHSIQRFIIVDSFRNLRVESR